jgi:peptidoglycan/LPS O-acetylase OafA/YrhL
MTQLHTASTATPSLTAASPLAGRRNQTIDAIRVFAAAGIVFVHAVEAPFFDKWGNLFRFGVPFFLFASLYFQSLSLRRNADRPLGRFIAERFARLYLPFLVWGLIYLLARDAERITINHLPPVRLRLSMLWTGTEYHLWFLPFLLAWVIALAVLYHALIRRDSRWRWLVIAAAVVAGCVAAARPAPTLPDASVMTYDNPAITYAYWSMAAPAALGAIAFACLMAMGPAIYSVPAPLGWAGLALVAACSIRQALHGIELAPRALTGLGSMLVALVPWKSSAIPPLARIGRRGYGIYLCHVIPVEMIHIIFHHLHLGPSPWLDVANFAVSFVGAIGIVLLLEKSPKTAWLNG